MHLGGFCVHAILVSALPLLGSLITGCATAQATSQEDAFSDVHTAVALTVSAASATTSPSDTVAAPSSATAAPSTSTPLPSSTPTSGVLYTYSSGCNNAAYLSDVTVADGEDMAPGETFTKTWGLLNTGNCPWSTNYTVVFVDGADMDATSAELDAAVAVGTSGNVSVDLTAPEDEGNYTSYWRLADASGTLFGEQFYVEIVVRGDVATVTPTPTATATASATGTSTPTAESATSTPEPTITTEFTSTPTFEAITSSPTETPHDQKVQT
jgi:hypothetical protein